MEVFDIERLIQHKKYLRDRLVQKISKNSFLKAYFFPYLLIFFLSIISYSNTFSSPFHYDDNYVIVKNPDIRSIGAFLKSLPEKEQRPVLMFTFLLNYLLGGLDVKGYHIFNFILHYLNSLLLFFIIEESLNSLDDEKSERDENLPISLFASLIFAVHPLATESVTYISSRSSLLSAFFIFLGLLFFIKSFKGERYDKTLSLFSLLAFILAVGSKEISVIFPLLILFYDFYFLTNRKFRVEKLKYIYAPCFFIVFLLISIKYRFIFTLSSPDKTQRPLYVHLLTELTILPKFAAKIFFPLNLNIAHFVDEIDSVISIRLACALLFWTGIAVLMKKCFRNYRFFSFALCWFILTLFPFLLFPLSDFISERWLYLSLISLSFLVAEILKYFFQRDFLQRLLKIFFIIIIILFSIMTFNRNLLYRDAISLWSDAVKKAPQNARAYGNLGYSYQAAGYPYKAIKYLMQSLSLDPYYPATYYNLATIYQSLGDFAKAVEFYEKDISLNPRDFEAYLNLGIIFQNLRNYDRAIEYFTSAVKISPKDEKAHSNLAMAYMGKGKIEKAIREYAFALSINPNSAEIHNNLAIAYVYQGAFDKAEKHFKKAISLNPKFDRALFNLAALYEKMNKSKEAARYYNKAIELNPDLIRKR
ncbi:MAG: tetratricopeptide repeat protein [Candidatus Schekmanbacteria bacterium]|nr:MAG: tetratricopeptide repeat protein [Candidatus Schekmanbacteria bacterium]